MTAPVPEEELSTAELVGVIAAVVAAQEAAQIAGEVSWEEAALALNIVQLGGTALVNVARQAIAALQREVGNDVLPHIDRAVAEATEVGIKTLVDISRGSSEGRAEPGEEQQPEQQPEQHPETPAERELIEDIQESMELVTPAAESITPTTGPVTPTSAPSTLNDEDDAVPTPTPPTGEAKALQQAGDVALAVGYTAIDTIAKEINLSKTWHSKQDKRVRPKHAALNGVTVKAENAFPGGIRYPHDPLASLDMVIGCRCVAKYHR